MKHCVDRKSAAFQDKYKANVKTKSKIDKSSALSHSNLKDVSNHINYRNNHKISHKRDNKNPVNEYDPFNQIESEQCGLGYWMEQMKSTKSSQHNPHRNNAPIKSRKSKKARCDSLVSPPMTSKVPVKIDKNIARQYLHDLASSSSSSSSSSDEDNVGNQVETNIRRFIKRIGSSLMFQMKINVSSDATLKSLRCAKRTSEDACDSDSSTEPCTQSPADNHDQSPPSDDSDASLLMPQSPVKIYPNYLCDSPSPSLVNHPQHTLLTQLLASPPTSACSTPTQSLHHHDSSLPPSDIPHSSSQVEISSQSIKLSSSLSSASSSHQQISDLLPKNQLLQTSPTRKRSSSISKLVIEPEQEPIKRSRLSVSEENDKTIEIDQEDDPDRFHYEPDELLDCFDNYASVEQFILKYSNSMSIMEKRLFDQYCLNQPNAMRFLATDHSQQLEQMRKDPCQLYKLPLEYLNELFYRSLYCYALEKKAISETFGNELSPISTAEYRKVCEEYNFSLKRVRYGLGVIDELFRVKLPSLSLGKITCDQYNQLRSWKHILYYLSHQAKAVFMLKQFHYFNLSQNQHISQSESGDVDGYYFAYDGTPTLQLGEQQTDQWFECTNDPTTAPSQLLITNNTPNIFTPTVNNKSNNSLLSCSTSSNQLSTFKLDYESPHSHDSGKGSSIRTNVGPGSHSPLHHHHQLQSSAVRAQSVTAIGLAGPGIVATGTGSCQAPAALLRITKTTQLAHMHRIDKYSMEALHHINIDTHTIQLHRSIMQSSQVEPQPNTTDAMLKFLIYIKHCIQLHSPSNGGGALTKYLQIMLANTT